MNSEVNKIVLENLQNCIELLKQFEGFRTVTNIIEPLHPKAN